MSSELTVILINLTIILIAYFYIYPIFAGNDLHKMSFNDLLATGISMLVVGSIYWDTGLKFNALLFDLNWFWFCFVTYLIMELPVAVWYWRKNKLGSS